MKKKSASDPCAHCSSRPGSTFSEEITMAFQPIFNVTTGLVFAQEALLRGKDGRTATQILDHVSDQNRYQFDQRCRTTAIEVASAAGVQSAISINFMPNAVYEPKNCIQQTLRAADQCNFDIRRIIFEFTEAENVADTSHLKSIIQAYREFGFRTAIDDFGAGYSGLNLLVDIVPDIIKLDRHLIVDIDTNTTRQVIVRNLVSMCGDLGIQMIAEGVETAAELDTLRSYGIELIQGFYLGKPQLGSIATEADNPMQATDAAKTPD